MTNHPPSVLWHCWLGLQTCKHHLWNDLNCVEWHDKPYTQSINLRAGKQIGARNIAAVAYFKNSVRPIPF